ncbi:hypothetical protein GCM10011391_19850 [Pullulanibacillus camelliae]|uniref:YlbE-like protein n=1 Tax=Pullulanibacillus camelliae TaxID=1707096 RepID=A0A8J2VXX2_9BACL|nr:YlbE-like family protein [Pullulanibacillus camelliae]GGE41122.1 hypothetical protein GCM10011391_19850 [Pullulanibacillus camelliae]
MRPEVIAYLDHEPRLWEYIHQNPKWYQELSRYPEKINVIKSASDDYFGKSLSKRVERLGDYLTMINMFIQMSTALEQSEEAKEE